MNEPFEWLSAEVEADGVEADDEKIDELADVVSDLGMKSAVISRGDETIAIRWGLPVEPSPWPFQEIIKSFTTAMAKAGLNFHRITRVELQTEDRLDRELSQPAETYLGVSEVADLLGVSKQRVSELRTASFFPAPLAEVASGPVWKGSALSRFASSWERKPGRPRKVRPARSA